MRCPQCGEPDTRVTDSRDSGPEIRRRRECANCGGRFTTYERVQPDVLTVVKRDGRREEFSREKLLRSIQTACVKRPIPSGQLEKLTHEIEGDLRRPGKSEVPTAAIGDAALARLCALDAVAYLRYASVYRNYDSPDGFIEEVEALRQSERDAGGGTNQLELIPNEFAASARRRARRGRRPSMTAPALAANNPLP